MFDHRYNHRAVPDRAFPVYDRHTGKQVGLIGNISEDGLLLLCEDELGIGQMFELSIALPSEIHGRQSLDFDAESVWCAPIGHSGLVGCGLRLRHLDDAESEIVEQLIRDCVL